MSGIYANVPTWKEQGVDLVWSNWRAIVGPKGMTPAQVKTWQDVLSKVYASPEWKEELQRNYWGDDFTVGDKFNKDLADEYAVMKSALAELGKVGLIVADVASDTYSLIEVDAHLPSDATRKKTADNKIRQQRKRKHDAGDHTQCLERYCDCLLYTSPSPRD